MSRPVWPRRVGKAAVGIPVVMANPSHGERQIVFVAALGYDEGLQACTNQRSACAAMSETALLLVRFECEFVRT